MNIPSEVSKIEILEALTLGELWLAWGKYKTLQSARVQAQKYLNNLVDLNLLERGKGYYRLKGVKSEYGEHARLLTAVMAKILKAYPDSLMLREHTIHEVGLRPDALVLLVKEGKGRCLWIECKNLETDSYFEMKKNALKSWDARPYLSKLFGYHIPAYELRKDSELEEL